MGQHLECIESKYLGRIERLGDGGRLLVTWYILMEGGPHRGDDGILNAKLF